MKIYLKILSLLLISILCFTSCEKGDDTPGEQNDNQDPNAITADNVEVILTENSELVSSESELSSGIYKIQFNETPPEIEVNDIIVGDEGYGFLRRITGISSSGNELTMQTTQANMEDVFGNTNINFTTNLAALRGTGSVDSISSINYQRTNYERFAEGVSKSDNGFLFDFADVIINSNPSVSLRLSGGSITYSPNYVFDLNYSLFSIDKFEFSTQGTEFNAEVIVNLDAEASPPLPLSEFILYENSITFVKPVPGSPVPLVVTIFFKLKAVSELTIGGSLSLEQKLEHNTTLSMGAKYENNSWTPIADLDTGFIRHPLDLGGSIHDLTKSVKIVPEVIIAFYGVNGPLIEPSLSGNLGVNLATINQDWDANLYGSIDLSLGASVGIFGETIVSLPFDSYNFYTESIWNAPDNIELISGNNQTGNQGEQLGEPLKVKVWDSSGLFGLKNVPVYFNVTSGNGSLSNQMVLTNIDGIAEVNWTLGISTGSQSVEVKVKKADGSFIESTVIFTANGEGTSSQTIDIVSGNNQSGDQNQTLNDPLVVMVKDNLGNAVSGQEVVFQVISGGGSLSQEILNTDQNGIAQTNWTLGDNQDAQIVEAIIADNGGSTIDSVTFNAQIGVTSGCGGISSFTDPRDGQVYPVVEIGDQCWFAKNLNYTTGNSWCYDDDPSNCDTYGRLYDWQTALTSCPEGWHIPSDAEWTQLTDYLGGQDVAGGKMKSISSLWNAPNGGATNSSGFSGFPGGYRFPSGNFGLVGNNGLWWSSTENTPSNAWNRVLGSINDVVGRIDQNKTFGLSCRCLKD